MLTLPYKHIVAKNEAELEKKLIALSKATGFQFKIITIYPKGKKVIAWYYADTRAR